MPDQRVAGLITVKVDGEVQAAAGEFSYNLGIPLKETMAGTDGIHGFKETPQEAFIEGEIRDRAGLDLAALFRTKDASVSIELANGKMIMLRHAWFSGEGTASTGDAVVPVKFSGLSAEEV
jgi:hypothetical protein